MTENGKKKRLLLKIILKDILIGQPEVMQLLISLDQGALGTADMGLAYSQVRPGR